MNNLAKDIATKYRVVAAEQFGDSTAATRMLSKLESRGVVKSTELSVVVVRRVEQIAEFAPGQTQDLSEELAAELHRRWTSISPVAARVYWASRRAVHLLGGEMPGRLSQPDAISHDLGTTAVALYFFSKNVAFRDAWVPEVRFPDVYGLAKPDAALADASGIRCLIEFCGHYNADCCRALARLTDRVGLPLLLFTIALGGE